MPIELDNTSYNDHVGKPSKFKAIFKGTYQDLNVSLTVEAETERDVMRKILLVPYKDLELIIKDPQTSFDQFCPEEMKETDQEAQGEAYRDERRRKRGAE